MTKKEFLEAIEEFLNKTEMPPSTLGLKALEDPMFVFRMRRGRECREKTQNRVLNFIHNHKVSE